MARCSRQWPSITSGLGQCIVLSGVSDAGMESVIHIVTPMQLSENTVQLRKVYSRPSDGLVLGLALVFFLIISEFLLNNL